MASLHVHNLFLWSVAVIYLFAFASLYHQLPGLYGDRGILPAAKELPKAPNLDWQEISHHWWNIKPTLLWITQSLGIDVQTSMDILALLGIGLSSLAIVTRFARNMLVFGALWALYLSFYSVGSIFLWFQWDALLMEAGFLAFVFSPIPLLMPHRIHVKLAGLSMWPVKWLFFRLMFMSGMVKLQSGCPTWWKLTALHHHYESQCIPTFIAWYIHQLPGWFDKLTVLHALFTEVLVPFLFFAPTRGLRKFAFYNQMTNVYKLSMVQMVGCGFSHHRWNVFSLHVTCFVVVFNGQTERIVINGVNTKSATVCGGSFGYSWFFPVIFQIGIIITGNYNWFNLLSIVLSLSLLDDSDLGFRDLNRKGASSTLKSIAAFLFNILAVTALLAVTGFVFNVRYHEKEILQFKAGQLIAPLIGFTVILLLVVQKDYFKVSEMQPSREDSLHFLAFFVLAITCLRSGPERLCSSFWIIMGVFNRDMRDQQNLLYSMKLGCCELQKLGFTEQDLKTVIAYLWPTSVILALVSFVFTIGKYFSEHDPREGILIRLNRGLFLGFYMIMALGIFSLSLTPYSSIAKPTALGSAGARIRQFNQALDKLNIVNGYGLFRRMTGVEGRPELILEGSNDIISGWKPYEFYYKPGKLDRAPPFVAPHQPRLDWQMWFAALGDQNSSPWIYNLVYRLLQGQPEVLRLIDPSSPFHNKPPKYIRGQLYKYWFTSITDIDKTTGNSTADWWTRKFDREWLSPVSLEDEKFLQIAQARGLTKPVKQPRDKFRELHNWVKMVRDTTATLSAPMFIWSLFMVNVVFHRTLKALRM